MQTNSPTSERAEVRAPRIFSLPSEFDAEKSKVRAEEMIDLAQLAGLMLDPWQEFAAEGMTRTRTDDKWSATEVALLANRQNGKGSIMEARQLAGLFLWGETLQAHTSHEFRTSQKHFERILSLIEATPTLDNMVRKVKLADGEESIITKEGMTLQFMARSLKSGRGITGNVVYFDEAFALKQQMIASLMSTLSARSVKENPQIFYASSAGMPESETLWTLRESGVKGDNPRLAYMEWSAPDDADADDPEVWAASNPAFGIRISEEFVRSERSRMGDEEFKRERLGIWAKLGGESVLDQKAWADGLDESVPALPAVAFAVDVPPSRDKADIVMVGFREDGEPFTELIERRFGTSWVPSRLAELDLKHSPVAIVIDAASGAGALLPEIKRAGVRTLQLSPREYFQACGQVFDLISQGKLHHPGQDELNEAVDAAQQKVLGGGLWKWTRGNDVLRDISPLVAITLAWHGLSKRGRIERTKRRALVL